MFSFGFTFVLINGLLLVAYLKIICRSQMLCNNAVPPSSEQSLITKSAQHLLGSGEKKTQKGPLGKKKVKRQFV